MANATRKHTDPKTGIEFSITCDWPWLGKDEKAEEIASPIVRAVSPLFSGSSYHNSYIHGVETAQVDIVMVRQCRLLGFKPGPCTIDYTGSPRCELAIKAPSGETDNLVLENSRIKYRDIDVPIDEQRMTIRQILSGITTLPFDVVLGNGYFLQREMKFVKDNISLIEEIINRSVAESEVWKSTPHQGSRTGIVLTVDETKSNLGRPKDIKYSNLTVVGSGHIDAETKGTVRAYVTTYGVSNGIVISTDKTVDVIEMPEDIYGVFSLDPFKGGDTRYQSVAVTDGKTTRYHPSIQNGDMQTENRSEISIPFMIKCSPKDVDGLSTRIIESLKSQGDEMFKPRYMFAFDLEKEIYMGVVQMPVGNVYAVNFHAALKKVDNITQYLTEKVEAVSLPNPEQLRELPGM